MVGAEFQRLVCLGVAADGRDHLGPSCPSQLDCCRADAASASLYQDRLTDFQLGVVEQHVLGRAKRHRGAGSGECGEAVRYRDDVTHRYVHQFPAEPVNMKAVYAADVLAQVVASFTARRATATGLGPVESDKLARLHIRHI